MQALKLDILNKQFAQDQFTQNLIEIERNALRLITPQKLEKVSEYVSKHRYVTAEESAFPGYWDNSLAPYAVPIMDAFCDPEVYEITIMASAQITKTEIIKNIIFWIVLNDPGPILVIFPNREDAEDFSNVKLQPMIDANPILSKKFAKNSSRSKDNKTLFKKFEGGFLALSGSNSAMGLRRRSIKYLIIDDRDGVTTAGDEGDAAKLAEQRLESYRLLGAKKINCSSPTIKGLSKIKEDYDRSDQGEIQVPCPHCGEYQYMDFDNMVWDKIEMDGIVTEHFPETVKLYCIKCGAGIEEKHKQWMEENLKVVRKKPEITKHRGFLLNRFYSFFSNWKNHIEEFLDAKNDRTKLQVVFNTIFAKLFEIEESSEVDETGLMDRNEDYLTEDNPFIPNEILVLTAGVDTQPDRLELLIVGFAALGEPYILNYLKFPGDPDQSDVWNELEEYIDNYSVRRNDGAVLRFSYIPGIHFPVYVDSGGRNTQSVYRECKKRQRRGWMAVKGKPGGDLPTFLNRTLVGKNRDTFLQNIGVDDLKTLIMKMLVANKSPNQIHTSKLFGDINFFLQLTSEKVRKKYDPRKGVIYEWYKKSRHRRNEVLDMLGYAIASMLSLSVKWDKLEKKIKKSIPNKNDQQELEIKTAKTEKSKKKKRTRSKSATGFGINNYGI